MGIFDGLILAAFILYAALSGLRARKVAGRDLEQYFLAGRSLPGWKAGVSMASTQFAADTPLVVMGIIATSGVFFVWRFWIYGLAFLLMGFLLAASWRRAGVLTDAELAELRYGGRPAAALRGIKAVYFGTVFNCVVLAMVLLAATRIAEPFLVWHEWLPGLVDPLAALLERANLVLTADATSDGLWQRSASNLLSLLLILGVTALYSTTGGLRTVVNTDVLQFVLMMTGSVVFAWIVVRQVGGLDRLPEELSAVFEQRGLPGGMGVREMLAFTPGWVEDAGFLLMAVIALQWLAQINADGTGYLAQRSMACRSDGDAKQAAVVFTLAQVLLRSLVWLPLGVGLVILFPDWDASAAGAALQSDREFTFVRGMSELLPAGVKGLLVTAMLAALASTVDTHLNWGSSYWTNDIYRRFLAPALKHEPTGRGLVWVARGSNLLILIIAILVMFALESIRHAWETSLLIGAGIGVVLVLRWLWWRINAWGEIAAMAGSLGLMFLVILTVENGAARWLIVAGGGTVFAIVASLLTAPECMDRLSRFHARARPPGFWGKVALEAGLDPAQERRRLLHGLLATFTGGLSIFLVLVGAGSWLIGSPPPVWMPGQESALGRGIFIGGSVLVGLALTPIWWRLGFGPGSEIAQVGEGAAPEVPEAEEAVERA
ncbi:MAG: sodium:solute symporter family protein [Myxococcota bacterium]